MGKEDRSPDIPCGRRIDGARKCLGVGTRDDSNGVARGFVREERDGTAKIGRRRGPGLTLVEGLSGRVYDLSAPETVAR